GAGGGNMYGWNQHFFHGEHAGLGGGCAGCGHLHTNWLHGGWFHGHGCIGCGSHSLLHRGGFAGQDCSTCTAPTTAAPAGGGSKAELSTDPTTRLAGAGAPEDFAGYYADLPAIETQGVPTASSDR
ncbi:MAG TPA: hypothetical protein VLM40_17355, partial [Gemmata sp.]|nr:hypothetical protein [Gemmata sp.]